MLVASLIDAGSNGAKDDLMRLDIAVLPFELFADRVWELRHNMTSYDASYVALAEELRLPFATLDRRLTRSKAADCEFLTPPR